MLSFCDDGVCLWCHSSELINCPVGTLDDDLISVIHVRVGGSLPS